MAKLRPRASPSPYYSNELGSWRGSPSEHYIPNITGRTLQCEQFRQNPHRTEHGEQAKRSAVFSILELLKALGVKGLRYKADKLVHWDLANAYLSFI